MMAITLYSVQYRQYSSLAINISVRTVYVQRASSGTSACCMEPWVRASISSEYSEYSESGDACHQTVSRGAAGPKAAWNKSGELLASSTLRSGFAIE